ncbi:MAG: hypothetical protein A2046_11980 [Bacteroidetes bacterium GWA2_30_7]|nr:MAG: hypothetical protein A2046_11980 [Bacteroidetes bacterium GWA2_30_7]
MNVSFSKNFEKQLNAITNRQVINSFSDIIQNLIETSSLITIPNLKKIKGHKSAYRIRIGDYRIGFYFEKNNIFITTIAHRKDIYKRFP